MFNGKFIEVYQTDSEFIKCSAVSCQSASDNNNNHKKNYLTSVDTDGKCFSLKAIGHATLLKFFANVGDEQ